MMTIAFTTFALLVFLVILFLIYRTLYSIAAHEPLLPDQDYRLLENGDLAAPGARFDAANRVLVLQQEQRSIPLDHIQGVYLRGLPSRRIGIGVVLDDGEEVLLSHIANNEMHRAARNAELIAQVATGQGAVLREQIERESGWREVLMGTPFVFHFDREPA